MTRLARLLLAGALMFTTALAAVWLMLTLGHLIPLSPRRIEALILGVGAITCGTAFALWGEHVVSVVVAVSDRVNGRRQLARARAGLDEQKRPRVGL